MSRWKERRWRTCLGRGGFGACGTTCLGWDRLGHESASFWPDATVELAARG